MTKTWLENISHIIIMKWISMAYTGSSNINPSLSSVHMPIAQPLTKQIKEGKKKQEKILQTHYNANCS